MSQIRAVTWVLLLGLALIILCGSVWLQTAEADHGLGSVLCNNDPSSWECQEHAPLNGNVPVTPTVPGHQCPAPDNDPIKQARCGVFQSDASATVDSEGKISGVIQTIIGILGWVIGIMSVIVIIVQSIRLILSDGSGEVKAKVTNAIIYAGVGLILAVLAIPITRLFINIADESVGSTPTSTTPASTTPNTTSTDTIPASNPNPGPDSTTNTNPDPTSTTPASTTPASTTPNPETIPASNPDTSPASDIELNL